MQPIPLGTRGIGRIGPKTFSFSIHVVCALFVNVITRPIFLTTYVEEWVSFTIPVMDRLTYGNALKNLIIYEVFF